MAVSGVQITPQLDFILPVFPESATRFVLGLLPVLLCGATDRDDMPLVQWQGAKVVSSWDRWSQTHGPWEDW